MDMSHMSEPRSLRTSITVLILWFCLGSLILLSGIGTDGLFAPMYSEIDLENYDPLGQNETDDDFFVLLLTGIVAGSIILPSRTQNLDLQPASLSPDSPPPK
jgi:hypothetical protein